MQDILRMGPLLVILLLILPALSQPAVCWSPGRLVVCSEGRALWRCMGVPDLPGELLGSRQTAMLGTPSLSQCASVKGLASHQFTVLLLCADVRALFAVSCVNIRPPNSLCQPPASEHEVFTLAIC